MNIQHLRTTAFGVAMSLGLSLGLSTSLEAAIIQQDFSGMITYADDPANPFGTYGDNVSGFFEYDDILLTNTGFEDINYTVFNITVGSVSFSDDTLDPLNTIEFFDGAIQGFFDVQLFDVASTGYDFFGGPGANFTLEDGSSNLVFGDIVFTVDPPASVPEPATVWLLAISLLLVLGGKRRSGMPNAWNLLQHRLGRFGRAPLIDAV